MTELFRAGPDDFLPEDTGQTTNSPTDLTTEARARESGGTSADAIYQTVAQLVHDNNVSGHLYDIGCGTGALRAFVGSWCSGYTGVDAVPYDLFPPDVQFLCANLDATRWPIADGVSDITVSVETIEHLENPRAFFRELTRITRPGGLIVVTTPNQLSLLSKLTFVVNNQFNAFQERPGLYPAHRTALLEIDLIRIASELGLEFTRISYTGTGRIPGTSAKWPRWLPLPVRTFSDNVLLSARRPCAATPVRDRRLGPRTL